ncbi:MAG TPA: GNAT family N-acetyltransferase [Polyangiaceae bacterium]
MANFVLQRATDRHRELLQPLCAEATARHAGLWSARKASFDPGAWLGAHAPVIVVLDGQTPIGFAAALTEGAPLAVPKNAEAVVYVSPAQRKRGAGRAAMSELLAAARTMGLWKMVAYTLPEDAGARTLLERVDFREVGILAKHVQLEGAWKDVAIHERLVLAARRSRPSISDA